MSISFGKQLQRVHDIGSPEGHEIKNKMRNGGSPSSGEEIPMQGRASRVLGASRLYSFLGVIVMGLLPSTAATAAITLTSDPTRSPWR